MSSTCADSTLPDILGSVRRGDVVRVLNDKEASEPNSPAGHFVLAAETVSPNALNRLLRFTDSVPVFATTRDRLEQLRIVGAPYADDQHGNHDRQSYIAPLQGIGP